MPHRHHTGSAQQRSQEMTYRRIEWLRQAKRWLRKGMIIIIILLALAVLLSYIFISKEPEPRDIEVRKPIMERL